MSKDSNVAGGNGESSQNLFGFISDFFEQVGKVLMGAFKQFTDFLSSLFGGSDDSASLNVNPVEKNRIVEHSSFISESSQSEDKNEEFISLCTKMFFLSDKFGEFSRESSMDNKKNILKQYFQNAFPEESCFDEDMVNKIYKNLSEEFVSTVAPESFKKLDKAYKDYTDEEVAFVEEFIENYNYQYSNETREFNSLDDKAKKEEIQRFFQIKEPSGGFNIDRLLILTELMLRFRETPFHDSSCDIEMGVGVSPRLTIRERSNPSRLEEGGGLGGGVFLA